MTTLLNASALELKLQTRLGNDIDNGQSASFSSTEEKDFAQLEKRYAGKDNITFRTPCSYYYNCHGMTFAARRTMINLASEVRKILNEDDYELINDKEVLPGDIAVYLKDNGDIEHSALVLSCPDKQIGIPMVVSKWGKYKEVIHWANDCPYKWDRLEYYRVTK